MSQFTLCHKHTNTSLHDCLTSFATWVVRYSDRAPLTWLGSFSPGTSTRHLTCAESLSLLVRTLLKTYT